MTAERIGLAGKTWFNPLCCHSPPATKQRGLDQILPGHLQAKFGPILCAVMSCRWPRRQNLVQSSVLSFPTGGQGHDSKEDWNKFCRDIRGQNLVQSSLLSFPTSNQGNDGTKDWTKFCQDGRGQKLVQSSPLSFHTGGPRTCQQRGLDQILPGQSRAKFDPILSAVISDRWPRT